MSTDATRVQEWARQLEQATTTADQLTAIQGLGATGHVDALGSLVKAFGFNRPAVGDAALTEVLKFGAAAVLPLLETVDGYDYGARAYTVRALARIGDARALEFLLQAIQTDFAPSVRRAATRGLGQMASTAAPDPQQQVLTILTRCLAEPDWGVRYAAICALDDWIQADASIKSEAQVLIEGMQQDPEPLLRVKAEQVLTRWR